MIHYVQYIIGKFSLERFLLNHPVRVRGPDLIHPRTTCLSTQAQLADARALCAPSTNTEHHYACVQVILYVDRPHPDHWLCFVKLFV